MTKEKMPKEEDKWRFYKDVNFSQEDVLHYNVDTRDFHCGWSMEKYDLPPIDKILKYKERFFFTPEEVVAVLDRIYEESGGKGSWRMLDLKADYCRNWDMKYIRIHRFPEGLVMCNRHNRYLNKDTMNAPVDKEYLSHH